MGIYTAQIQQLYVAYFNRPADVGGLDHWEKTLVANKGNVNVVAQAFAKEAEYKAEYGNMDPFSVVATVYKNLFNRVPDKEGLLFWASDLRDGKITVGDIAAAIAKSAGEGDKQVFANKVTAATKFTDSLDTSEEIIAYQTGKANGLAKNFIAGITTDASLQAAISDSALAALSEKLIDVGSVVEGQTFTLTQGLDTLTGTAGNDTFNAFAFNSVSGADTTTLQTVDTIDGGAGKDTLNIEVKADGGLNDFNGAFAGKISNVEIININNVLANSAAAVDATVFGAEAKEIWQIGQEADVTKLAATTTAGFRSLATAQVLNVTPADAAAKVTVALDDVAEASTLNVLATGTGILNSVVVAGNVTDTDSNGTVADTNVNVTVGKNVQTLTVNSAVATNLSITDGAGTKKLTTIDASASTGAITYADSETTVATVKTGSGKDDVTLKTLTAKDDTATTADETINALAATGAGDDIVEVDVSGDGKVTVQTGAGDDEVHITGRGTAALVIEMGDGADTFTSDVAIASTDSIDAGAGSDTLLLSLVGSSNVGAFKNFDVFDVNGMGADLDLDILNAKNTVAEIVGSGAVTAATALLNIAAGVNFRATADMVFADNATIDADEVVTLTQKTAGALTVTLDADETGTADATDDVAGMSIAANAATSITAVFDTAYLGAAGAVGGETAATDNVSTIALATQAATAITVVSGGAHSQNVLNVTEGAGTDALATITVNGAQALTLSVSGASKLATIDASAATGGLTFSMADLKDGGTVKLGSGVDKITVTSASTTGAMESIVGFEKAAAAAVGDNATAAAAAIADADVLALGVAQVANANGGVTTGTIAKGVLTFTGAGPSTLAAAISIANDAAETVGEAVVFEYLGNSYVFVQGGTDIVVKLTGTTGITNFVEDGTTNNFFIV